MIRFESAGVNGAGEKVYDLILDGRTARRGLTMDQVVEAINRQDEESLGEEHGAGKDLSAPLRSGRDDRGEELRSGRDDKGEELRSGRDDRGEELRSGRDDRNGG